MDTRPNGERIFPSSSSSTALLSIACTLHLHRPTWWGSHQASFQWSLVSAASLQKFKRVSKEGFFSLIACKCRSSDCLFPLSVFVAAGCWAGQWEQWAGAREGSGRDR